MSADNGIYLLQTKDGYRVKHMQAVENLWWSNRTMTEEESLDPVETYLEFASQKVFETKNTALEYTEEIFRTLPVVEYGIVILPEDFAEITFEELRQKAVEEAKASLPAIRKAMKSRPDIYKHTLQYYQNLIKQDKYTLDLEKLSEF